jgi:DNA repair protein RadC
MRARLKQEGPDHFESHQLLEMYLFPLLPRRDTNEIAHRLLERFGSLQDIFLASHEDLIQVEGISDITASSIEVTAAVIRRIAIESYHPPKKYDHFEDIGLDTQCDFYDKRHVNFAGTVKFTDYLSEYIEASYDLPSNEHDEKLWEERVEYINEKLS